MVWMTRGESCCRKHLRLEDVGLWPGEETAGSNEVQYVQYVQYVQHSTELRLRQALRPDLVVFCGKPAADPDNLDARERKEVCRTVMTDLPHRLRSRCMSSTWSFCEGVGTF